MSSKGGKCHLGVPEGCGRQVHHTRAPSLGARPPPRSPRNEPQAGAADPQSVLPAQPSQVLRPTALPRQNFQIFQRRQQPLSRAVTAGRSRAASRPLLLLLSTRRRRHLPHRPAAGDCAAEHRRGEAGSGGGSKGHRGGGGKEAKATAPPMRLEMHCGRRRHLMGQRGVLRSNPGRRAREQAGTTRSGCPAPYGFQVGMGGSTDFKHLRKLRNDLRLVSVSL